ncbi:MAG: tripartite tricarboxylate transporter substrate-binding protein [Alphaproteobacteria bacterium]|nr:tripartite tricarboxylate transporter substrate-binding protein [Alphaproteobacteria bacterium]
MTRAGTTGWAAACALALLSGLPQTATAAEADFYKGKKVTFYVGYSPGGGYDTYSRLAARHLGKHIPGQPGVIVKNRPGAGSLRLANELYSSLPQDGTVIGMIGNNLHLLELVEKPNIRFVATKFNWLGRLTDGDTIFVVRPSAGVNSFDDVRRKQVLVGVPGAGSATTMMLTVVNNVLGAKFKLISGYKGSSGIRLAVERGEVEGLQSIIWSVHKPWIQRNNFKVLYQIPVKRLPSLKDIPSIIEYAKTPEQKRLINFFSSYVTVGRSVVAPPGIPKGRVAALRAAFMEMTRDPALLAEVKKKKMRFRPMSGEDLQALIASAFDLSDDLKAKAKEAAKVGKLKKRKIVLVTTTAKIVKRNKKGSRLTLEEKGGKTVKALVHRRRTKITIDGKKAKRGATMVGMTCEMEYEGSGSEATKLNCRN